MLALSGIQAVKIYSSQAKVGEFLSSKKAFPSSTLKLNGIDQVDISGRAKAISVAKSFAARLTQATTTAEASANTSVAAASNVGTASHLLELAQIKRKNERDEKFGKLPNEASLGFSKVSSEPLPKTEVSQEKPRETSGNKPNASASINDFSLKFIRALNPIPV